MKTENTKNEQMETARIRFGLIAPMVQGTFPDESLAAYCRRVAAFPVKLPDGRQVQYKAKTLTKWLSKIPGGTWFSLPGENHFD